MRCATGEKAIPIWHKIYNIFVNIPNVLFVRDKTATALHHTEVSVRYSQALSTMHLNPAVSLRSFHATCRGYFAVSSLSPHSNSRVVLQREWVIGSYTKTTGMRHIHRQSEPCISVKKTFYISFYSTFACWTKLGCLEFRDFKNDVQWKRSLKTSVVKN